MSEKRDNSGTLGKNERKTADNHPTHTGQCLIDGTEYWISAWVKEGKNGRFFSLAFKPKEQQRVPASASTRIDLNDEIPF
jgi:hypothetical protein